MGGTRDETPNKTQERTSGPRRWRRRIGFALYCVVAIMLLMEIGIRILATKSDGHVTFANLKLVPFPTVPDAHREILELPESELPYVIPDHDLGWTIRPNGRTTDGLFAANSLGLRSAPREVVVPKPAGISRVLLIGDSYTHGDEVPWVDTWSAHLQTELGSAHEVINGAVGGYGTDQAVLRGDRLKEQLDPDIVVLGIYRQDLLRNLTVFRAVKHPFTNYPWSKPRFVVDDSTDSGLRLVNHPVAPWPPPQAIEFLEDYDAHPELKRHDRLWCDPLYADSTTYGSWLWRFVASKRIHRDRFEDRQALMRGRGEGVVVTARLARLFRSGTTKDGARAVVLLLPGVDEIPGYADGGRPPLRDLHEELDRLNVPYLDVGAALRGSLADGEDPAVLYVNGTGHPNARANAVIARTLATHLK